MAVWSVVRVSDLSPDVRWDAEHYKPEYLKQAAAMAARKTSRLRDVATISDGNHISIAEEFSDEGVRYLRGQDLSDFFISDADPIYIPEKLYNALARSHMHMGDVLVGIVGTIGSVGLITKRQGKLTGNCKLAIVRAKTLPAEYIAAYLASRVGQNEIQRRVRGAVQMGLILPDLKDIPVVIPTQAQCDTVVKSVRGAQAAREKATETITAAETLLLTALGLDHIDFSPSRSYSRTFQDLLAEGRFDAEFFHPRPQAILNQLRRSGVTIGDVAQLSERIFRPEQQKKGSTFRYIEIGSLTGVGEAEPETIAVAEAPSRAQFIVRRGDIITSTVRPIRRLSALIRPDQDGCVCSSGFAVLSPSSSEGGIESEVLLAYLRLPIVCEILDLYCTASMYPAIPVDRLLKVPVVVPEKRVRTKIVEHVRAALFASQEAARLLEQAKQTVEEMIGGTA